MADLKSNFFSQPVIKSPHHGGERFKFPLKWEASRRLLVKQCKSNSLMHLATQVLDVYL
jgi:hypothetical protein